MSKKKRFGISEALTRGLSETIHVVENNAGTYRNVVLPLSRIELDPDNPRKLAINLEDIRMGLAANDPLLQRKQEELERLKELAHTIKTSGVINPVVVYKLGEVYRVVAGERRCLAAILAAKQEIDARVFNEKPKGFDLKLIQWIENTAREDLTLDERLGNVREIMREYQKQQGTQEITATVLKNITGLSLPQTSAYLSALSAPQDVQLAIKNGHIRNLDKAALLSSISSDDARQKAMEACIQGASLREIRQIANQQKTLKKTPVIFNTSQRGPIINKINMGTTLKPEVIKTIVMSVLNQKEYTKYVDAFTQVNWLDLRQASKAFRKLIELLELEMVR